MASLTTLNGSVILATERKWAEIDYLKTHGTEWLGLGEVGEQEREGARRTFLEEHNR